jgi:putative transposase
MILVQQRELIVKLHEQGKRQQYIADLIGCSQPTVNKWIRNYRQGRTLQTLPRSGRPTKLSSRKLDDMKLVITREIKSANEKYCSLSTKQVGEIIRREAGTDYSLRHVERLMHKLGFSLITPRPQHLRHDQEKVDAFRDEFKKKLKRGTWVISS